MDSKNILTKYYGLIATWIAGFLLFIYSLHFVFNVVPNEKVMGPIQRIFYFHVASATTSYICFGLVFISGILYLRSKKEVFDLISEAAGKVGFLFCTIVLVSGMLWGHTAWNTWFRFEPRLVSFLLVWLLFLSFILLRKFGDSQKKSVQSAVVGIMGAIMVPIMIYSIKLLPAAAQLHPQVIENRGLRDPSFTTALMWMTISTSIFAFILGWLTFKIEVLKKQHGRHT